MVKSPVQEFDSFVEQINNKKLDDFEKIRLDGEYLGNLSDGEETEPIILLIDSVKKYQFEKNIQLKINEDQCCGIYYKDDTRVVFTKSLSSPFCKSSNKTEESTLPLNVSMIYLNADEVDLDKDITDEVNIPLVKLKNHNLKILILNCNSVSPFPQKYKYINQCSVSIFRFLAFSNLISSLWILKLSSCLAELIPDLELLFELYFPSNFKIVVEQISDLKTLKSCEYSDSQKESPYLKSVMNQKRNNSLINDTLRRPEAQRIVDKIKALHMHRFDAKPKVVKIEFSDSGKQNSDSGIMEEENEESDRDQSNSRQSDNHRNIESSNKNKSGDSKT